MSSEPFNPFSDHTQSPQTLVVLTRVSSYSLAATLADALHKRGVEALLKEGDGTDGDQVPAVDVMVRRIDLERSELVLGVFLGHPSAKRDPWPDSMGAESDEVAAARIAAGHRWAWTLVLAVLLPMGCLLTIFLWGPHQDPVMRMIGPGTLLVGATIALGLIVNKPDEND